MEWFIWNSNFYRGLIYHNIFSWYLFTISWNISSTFNNLKIRCYVWRFPLIRNIRTSLTVTQFVISISFLILNKICLISDISLFSLQNHIIQKQPLEVFLNSSPKKVISQYKFWQNLWKILDNLTESSFIIKLQTCNLKIHWKLNSFKGNFQRLFNNLENTFFQNIF